MIAVIMPVYNTEEYLGAAIDSVIGQTMSAYICLLMPVRTVH